jgi:hypothetical protein
LAFAEIADIVRRIGEDTWNTGDLTLVDQLFAPTCFDHDPGERVARGASGYKQLVAGFRAAVPDLHSTVEEFVADGDKLALRLTVRGNAARTGRAVTWTGMHMFRIADGQVIDWWHKDDPLTGIGLGSEWSHDITSVPDRAIGSVHSSVVIRRSIEAVFEYLVNPSSWPMWHSGSLGVSAPAGRPVRVGDEIIETFIAPGGWSRVAWHVQRLDRPYLFVVSGLIDRRVGTMHYALRETRGDTTVDRTFTYTVPTWWLATLDRFFLSRHLERASSRAMRRLQGILELAHANETAQPHNGVPRVREGEPA